MELWQLWILSGIFLVLIEIFMPTMFFLNLAISCFILAIFSYLGFGLFSQAILFAICSLCLIIFIRPLVLNTNCKQSKKKQTGFESKYLGEDVKILETVDKNNGVVTIYGERWEAKSLNPEEVINKNEVAKIVGIEGLTLIVSKKV